MLGPRAEKLKVFCAGMRDMLLRGEIQFRKAYLRLIVSEIVVGDDKAHVAGTAEALVAGATAGLPSETEVPTFIEEWRPQQDSNLQPSA